MGDARFYKGLQRTHGLGSGTPGEPSVLLDYYWTRTYATLYRTVAGPLRLGGGYHLDYYTGIKPSDQDDIEGVGSVASGVSANALIDTRDNALNASRGVYLRASYFAFPSSLGSDSSWQASQFEGRVYAALPSDRRQILAFWGLGWLTAAGDPPFFNLPSVGWDTYGRTARGYSAGRFRGRDWVYGEAEYRVDLMRNGLLGAVAFINASTLSNDSGNYGSWEPGGGGGVRIKLNKRHGTNIAIDLGFGRGSNGIWFGLNEAF
jgi:outer membrane protein assembly factor BamA